MTTEKIVEELLESVRGLGIEVRVERGGFRGGLCTIDGREVVLLNKRQPAQAHLSILAESIDRERWEDTFLPPAVRAALEDSWAAASEVALEEDDA